MFPPTGDDAPDAEPPMPDAEGADADPNAPDAEPGPDAESDDMMGPLIVAVSPVAGDMVAGEIRLEVTVTDADGVDEVAATFASDYTIDMTRVSNTSNWIGTFDTRVLGPVLFPTIVVRATDTPGNMSQLGYEIVLDNEGPFASLDPPLVREAQVVGPGTLQCSHSFDPVGGDAPDDGERVLQLSELRARVYDCGNGGSSGSLTPTPIAGIASVEIYVLDDTARPLIVDMDGDSTCDDINPQIVPTVVPSAPNEAAVVDLTSVPASGASFMSASMAGDDFAGSNAVCQAGNEPEEPEPLCVYTDLTRVIQTPELHTPEIYVVPIVSDVACMGYAFDALATNIDDGWACVAVRAVDNLGNVRVSAPLRVCIDSNVNSDAGCTSDFPPNRPDCLGTYNSGTGAVTQTDCSPDLIPTPGVAGDYELIRNDI